MRYTKRNYLFGSSRAAKLRRLKAKGLLPTKEELQQLCAQATATVAPTICEPGKPPESKRGQPFDRRQYILRG